VKRKRLISVTTVLAFCAVLISSPFALSASATDNVSGIHWHSKVVTYHLNSSLPSEWQTATDNAAYNWHTLFYAKGSNTSSTNPDGSDQIVWRGPIPSSWQGGCPPSNTIACTGYWYTTSDNHLTDADFVFNENYSLGTSSVWCFFGIGYDVQTVAGHEFGHWGTLNHSSDSSALMYGNYNGCKQTPTTHDQNSMSSNYAGH
jgi:hypothetical protein